MASVDGDSVARHSPNVHESSASIGLPIRSLFKLARCHRENAVIGSSCKDELPHAAREVGLAWLACPQARSSKLYLRYLRRSMMWGIPDAGSWRPAPGYKMSCSPPHWGARSSVFVSHAFVDCFSFHGHQHDCQYVAPVGAFFGGLGPDIPKAGCLSRPGLRLASRSVRRCRSFCPAITDAIPGPISCRVSTLISAWKSMLLSMAARRRQRPNPTPSSLWRSPGAARLGSQLPPSLGSTSHVLRLGISRGSKAGLLSARV